MAAGYVQELRDSILENSYDMSEMKRMVIGGSVQELCLIE